MSEKIKKGLEICALGDENQCWHCPYVHEPNNSCLSLPKDALNLINRQQVEIDKRNGIIAKQWSMINYLINRCEEIELEAREEFAEKLKEKAFMVDSEAYNGSFYAVEVDDIDTLLEEEEYAEK